jgi:mannose-6-phosphate isomerase-like protein (cupin superfamily)
VPDIDRRATIAALEAEGLCVTEWRDDPNTSYLAHSHPYREVRVVLEGSMTIAVAERAVDLRPGDRMDLDPGQEHSAVVGAAGVRYIAGTAR